MGRMMPQAWRTTPHMHEAKDTNREAATHDSPDEHRYEPATRIHRHKRTTRIERKANPTPAVPCEHMMLPPIALKRWAVAHTTLATFKCEAEALRMSL